MLTQEIGIAAGRVYEFLVTNGEATLSQLQRAVKTSQPNMVPFAVGWLAREGKIEEHQVGRVVRLRLKQ